MKSIFKGFYSTADEDLGKIWSSPNTLFVFDTNCLFNLYRCEDDTREDIIGVMKAIESRAWLPFQVAFEYQRGRRGIIEESINSLSKIKSELLKISTQNILSSAGIRKHLYSSLSDELFSLQEDIKKTINTYIDEKIEPRIDSKKSISRHDFIRDSIDSIFLNKTGPLPTQEKLDEIDQKGMERHERRQAPGFKDDAKGQISYFSGLKFQNKYGDLYLWMQLIEKAKAEEIKNVIFVSDDNKPDWWFTISGKTHGPLESLKTEICTEADIDNFRMVNQISFLYEAKNNLLNINIRDSSLKEIEELSSKPINDVNGTINPESNESPWPSFFKDNKLNITTDAPSINKLDSKKYNANELYELLYNIKRNLEETTIILEKATNMVTFFESRKTELVKILEPIAYHDTINSLKGKTSFLILLCNEIQNKISRLDQTNKFELTMFDKKMMHSMNELKSILSFADSCLDLLGLSD